jgi:hypothetical protein
MHVTIGEKVERKMKDEKKQSKMMIKKRKKWCVKRNEFSGGMSEIVSAKEWTKRRKQKGPKKKKPTAVLF